MGFLIKALGVVAGVLGIGTIVNEVTKNESETVNTVTSVFDIEGLLITLAVAGIFTLLIYLIKRSRK